MHRKHQALERSEAFSLGIQLCILRVGLTDSHIYFLKLVTWFHPKAELSVCCSLVQAECDSFRLQLSTESKCCVLVCMYCRLQPMVEARRSIVTCVRMCSKRVQLQQCGVHIY